MATTDRWLSRFLPMRLWWGMVNGASLRADVLAALTGCALLVPQAVAYASIAGLPPAYGLYTAIIPVVVAALFGSSWHLVSGPTAAISIVVFATLSPLASPGSPGYIELVLSLTLLVGLMKLGMGLAGLGVLVNFIADSVVIGFTAGAAVLIGAGQLKNLFGLAVPPTASLLDTLAAVVRHLGDTNPYALAVGLVTLAAGAATRRWLPKLPYMIGAMVAGTLFAALLTAVWGPRAAVAMVPALSSALPAVSLPGLSMDTLRQLAPIALALSILSLSEAVAIARSIALNSGQQIDSNQEFIGQGLSNVAGSFFSGYVSSGSFTRSGLNFAAGARTPLAAVASAALLVVVLWGLAPLVQLLPIPAMAAILLMVAYGLVDVRRIRSTLRTSRADAAVMGATLLAALLLQLEFAIYVGVTLSLMVFLERTSRPEIRDAVPSPGNKSYYFVPQNTEPDCWQMKMMFIDGPVYFGAVDHVQRRLRAVDAQNPAHKHLLLQARGINFIDSSGADLLGQEAARRRELGGALYFHRLQRPVVEALDRAGQLGVIGRENLHETGENVIDAIYPRLDAAVCRRCTARIFSQCQRTLPDGQPREPDQPAA